MSKTYLDGKLSVTSLAAPTKEDMAKVNALSDDEYKQFREEVRTRARNSPATDITIDEIWDSAVKKARAIKSQDQYAPL